jgi:large subunit ribosomal protein L40e
MLVYIKTLAGTKQNFDLEGDTTVHQIKNILQEKEGILIEQIKLIYGGKQLADENRLSDYNVEPGNTLHMVLQLRGG